MHSPKFQLKYMRIAQSIALQNTSCYSQKFGTIIVDEHHRVRGLGYNGPPAGTPHTDEWSYLDIYFWPQLTSDEKESFALQFNCTIEKTKDYFLREYHNNGICPRRLIGAKSGERSNLCSCQHAERNAIINSDSSLVGCALYGWHSVPCLQCAGAIINARITEVHCLDEVYHEQSKWLFQQAGVTLRTYSLDNEGHLQSSA